MARSLLMVCPSCERHLRVVDRACPFCGLALSAETRAALALRPAAGRLGRAALYALGMGTISLGAACGGTTVTNEDGGPEASTDAAPEACICPPYGRPADAMAIDAGNDITIAPPYGIPPHDAAPFDASEDADADATGSGDATTSDVTIAPPYGIPPFDSGH